MHSSRDSAMDKVDDDVELDDSVPLERCELENTIPFDAAACSCWRAIADDSIARQ